MTIPNDDTQDFEPEKDAIQGAEIQGPKKGGEEDAKSPANDPGQASPQIDPHATADDFATEADSSKPGSGSAESTQGGFIPEWVGPYRIVRKIGEGGMGAVYLAEQEKPIRRQVAVKIIGMLHGDSQQIVSRFEAERQALALMDHPNIARVLDGGQTADGAPYFAMELVSGVPFSRYCDERQLSIQQRLELLLPVCKAVQHAHQKGIIHRDLKPSNVLVAEVDGKPVPKVIDFGLAKATDQKARLTDKTMLPEVGALGTYLYMSPEQAEGNQADVDTRTDIYSLGVMLYESLTGSTPIDHATVRKEQQRKIIELICDREPPKPSARLSSFGDAISTVSQARSIQPLKLQRILSGELDWIVMKSLEKDRGRRYATANDFAADIERFLNDEAVLARPPSFAYRASKMLRRYRIAFGIGAAFAITNMTLLGLFAYKYFEADRLVTEKDGVIKQRDESIAKERELVQEKSALVDKEREARIQVEEVFNLQMSVFGVGDPLFSALRTDYLDSKDGRFIGELTKKIVVNELEEEKTLLSKSPMIRARLLASFGDLVLANGDLKLSRSALTKSQSLLTSLQEVEDEEAQTLLLTTQVSLGFHDFVAGDLKVARERLTTLQQILENQLQENSENTLLQQKLGELRLTLGLVYLELDELEKSKAAFESMASSIGSNEDPIAPLRQLAGKLFALGVEREILFRNDESTFGVMAKLATLTPQFVRHRGQLNENVSQALQSATTSMLLYSIGNQAGANAELKSMLTILQDSLGSDHVLNLFPLFYMYINLENEDQFVEALEYNTKLLALMDRLFGERKHPRISQILRDRADLLISIWDEEEIKDPQKLSDAFESANEAISIAKKALGERHWQVGYSYYHRAKVLRAQDLYDDALEDLEVAREILVEQLGVPNKYSDYCLRTKAWVYKDRGDLKNAESVLRERITLWQNGSQARLGSAEYNLAQLLWYEKLEGKDEPDLELLREVQPLLKSAIRNMRTNTSKFSKSIQRAQKILSDVAALDASIRS